MAGTRLASSRLSWSKSATAMVLLAAFAGRSYATDPPPHGTISSCADGQCQNCEIGSDESNTGVSSWNIEMGWPSCQVYSSATFKGAESKTGGGYDVWWNIGEPDDGCQILVMSPVGQDVAGANCGNVVLAQKNAGCYYTHLDSTFMTQYCCGSGDCAKAGVGGAKRSVTDVPELLARAAAGEDTFAVPINHGSAHQPIATFSLHDKHAKRAAENLESSPGLSLSARAARYAADVELRRRDDDICGPATNVGDSYTKAIGQIQVTDVLTCNSNSACNQQVGKQVTVSHTLTSQTTKTFQVSAGVDVAVEAGIAFFVEAKSTVTGHSDFAWGVIRSTGVSDTESETKTINQVYSQVPGTKGYIWFTPTLECQKKSMVCKGEELVVEQCDPALLQDGSQKGEMGFTTTG